MTTARNEAPHTLHVYRSVAVSCALPVASTAVWNVPAVLPDFRGAYLVPPTDVATEALAQALRNLVDAPSERDALGRENRERVIGHNTFEALLSRYHAPCEALLA